MFDNSGKFDVSSAIKLTCFFLYFFSLFANKTLPILAQSTEEFAEDAEIAEPETKEFTEVRIFCSTVLTVREVQQIFPDFAISKQSAKNLNLELKDQKDSSLLTSCPQQVIVIKPEQGKIITEADKQSIIQQITKLYIDKGYINSRAISATTIQAPISQNSDSIRRQSVPSSEENTADISSQNIATSIIVDEGKVDVVVEGTRRLKKYVSSHIQLAANPLNTRKLEDQLRLLKNDPAFKNIEATLQPAQQINQTQLKVRVTEARPFVGGINIDNYSPPSVGGERFGLGWTYRNLAGFRDEIGVAYSPRLQTFGGTYNLDFSYRIPVNAMDGTIQLKTSINRNEVIQGDFDDLDIEGESERYELNYRQPIVRNPRQEFAFSLGFDYQDGQTFVFQSPTPFGFGPDEEGRSRTSVLSLGTEYVQRDVSGAWGLRSKIRWGLGMFGATDNPDPTPDGKFISFLAQLQRLQVVNDSNFLIIQTDFQVTPNTLLPSEQFSIGGGQSVRGYRQNARSGDNGLRFSIEDRLTLASNDNGDSVFMLAPFFDMGFVWKVAGNPNVIPDQQFLIGLGLGLLWQPVEGFNLRLDYAPPLIELEDRGDDIQDNGLYFSAGYNF
ncbi:MAG: ShlB/FhaC/HecB family hemolysin secretion/activation protein [Pleurocapsa sp.]